MRCLYINLDRAVDRREALEASFRAHAPPDWRLQRIAALGPEDGAARPGALTPAEKACWLSHRRAVAETVEDDAPVLIVEDDVAFSARTFPVLTGLAAGAPDWDLLYTDVILTDFNAMVQFARAFSPLARAGGFRLHDLSQVTYAGAAGYVVRGASKRKLLAALDAIAVLDRPYDLVLRDLTRAGRLASRLIHPFLTSPGPSADTSQIQPDALKLREQVSVAFRMLMSADRDLDACRRYLDGVEAAHGDPGAVQVGRVFAAIAAHPFAP